LADKNLSASIHAFFEKKSTTEYGFPAKNHYTIIADNYSKICQISKI